MPRLRDPLFHVVVTLGAAAAASACGQTARPQGNADAAAGSSSGAESGGGGAGPQLVFPGAGAGGASAILTEAGAQNDPCSGGTANGSVTSDGGSAGEAEGLADCPPAQLRCASYSPTPTDCSCDRTAPSSACDCSDQSWVCVVFDPPMGCECVRFITGPK